MNTIKLIPLKNPTTSIIDIPGSKSYTNRALLIGALSENNVTIDNPLFSDDTKAMIKCLQTLGIKINVSANKIEIIGSLQNIKDKKYELNADLSGTTIRFILALSTIIPGTKIITGEEGLNKRPIKDLVDGLKQLGAEITYLEKEGFPPLRVTSSKLQSKTISINGGVSSQYFSALLMIAPLVGNIKIIVKGEQISKPYIDMTIDVMKQFGVEVINNNYEEYIISKKQNYNAKEYLVEGDFSSAGYFFAIAALTKSNITLKNLNPNSKQADKKLLDALQKMGSKIVFGNNEITIKGTGVKPLEIDVTDFPDQAQTLAVLAAFAKGKTILKGVQSLRVKETERVIALQTEFKKMGIKTTATNDSLTIFGGDPKPARIDTYGDHRMAMAFAVAGSKIENIEINNPAVVNKTFPNFWKKINEVGIQINNQNKTNIILIGMRGSGKTTIGKMLAKKLKKSFIDLDKELVKKSGMELAEIINKNGWNFFRDQEAIIAKENTKIINSVIATGGGFILKKENVDGLKNDGIFIFLNADPKILAKRIGDDKNRPPLNKGYASKDELELVLNERKSLYNEYANIVINTDSLTEDQTVNTITEELKGSYEDNS